jgi:CRISPR/Cas system CSM-associated protein Csm3 (group 7 of RAMP superfamily)
MTHLNPITTKVVGRVVFKPEATLHIGIGGWGVRREILKTSDRRLIIPASTWKGAFRQIGEKIAKKLPLQGLEKIAVDGYVENEKGITYEIKDEAHEKFVKALRGEGVFFGLTKSDITKLLLQLDYTQDEIEKIVKEDEEGKEQGEGWKKDAEEALGKEALGKILTLYCPITRLFGNTTIAGKLRFIDTITPSTLHIKPGVGIDRRSGTAKEDQLYFLEAASVDSNITLRFVADNIEPRKTDSILLGSILNYVEKLGLQIGARKSTGMGDLTMVEAEFYLVELSKDKEGKGLANPFKFGNKMDLKQFLAWLGTE